jgi:threonine/homoserine/homoserine lactone efflux protein
MMTIAFPLLAAAVAFLAAIPLGPVNMEIIRRVLDRRSGSAWLFASGAAAADGLWPLVTFFGLAPLLQIRWVAVIFWGAAALILFFLGGSFLRDVMKKTQDPSLKIPKENHGIALIGGFFLVVSNPTNLVTWVVTIGVFYNEEFLPPSSILSGLILWFSVAMGSFIYFSLIILLVKRFSRWFIAPHRLRFLKTLFGFIILGVAVYFALHLIRILGNH